MGFMNKTKISCLKLIFWLTIALTIASTISILYCYNHSILINTRSTVFSDTIFSNGLNLIFSIIAFLIALIIFLIQYVGAKFGSHELEKFPISCHYFIITPLILVLFMLFNFLAIYFKLIFPYTLISLVFSGSVILLVGVTVILSFYYLDISNIIAELNEQVIKFIEKSKPVGVMPLINRPIGYSEEFVGMLNEKTSPFIKTSIEAINKDQDRILRTSLDSLDAIMYNYLKSSKEFYSQNDAFLLEMNDQFNFIIAESLKSYNQKILEDVAKTIGNISVNIIKYRRGFGNRNDLATHWVATLNDLFRKSYPKDRTIVCHICLDKINEVILSTLDNKFYDSYELYKAYLDENSQILSKRKDYWAAILLQKALSMYKKQFLKFITISKTSKTGYDVFEVESYFNTLVEIINNSKTNHDSSNLSVIFASFYGIPSFAQEIASIGLMSIEDHNKRNITYYTKSFINFNKQILYTSPEKNDFRIYNYFSEVLFLITKRVDLTQEDKEMLVEVLSNDLLGFVQLVYTKSADSSKSKIPSYLEEATIDYFALLIYLYHDKPHLIRKVIKDFSDIYVSIKKRNINDNIGIDKKLYKEIKLYSCWINVFNELKGINTDIIDLLKADFSEPDYKNKVGFAPLLVEYGYPTTNLHDFWHLRPSDMWGYVFQEDVSRKLNGDGGSNYIKFHKLLKNQ